VAGTGADRIGKAVVEWLVQARIGKERIGGSGGARLGGEGKGAAGMGQNRQNRRGWERIDV